VKVAASSPVSRLILSSRVSGVSKDEATAGLFETALSRLLTMGVQRRGGYDSR